MIDDLRTSEMLFFPAEGGTCREVELACAKATFAASGSVLGVSRSPSLHYADFARELDLSLDPKFAGY